MSTEPQSAADAGDAQTVPQYRGLKTAVIVMGILLVVGFIVVFSTIIYRVVNPGSEGSSETAGMAQPGYVQQVAVPAGARIERTTVDGDRLVVEATLAEGTRLLIVLDAKKGREIGRFELSDR